MSNKCDEMLKQRERSPAEKILATLVIETERWVGFFPENKIQEAKKNLLQLLLESMPWDAADNNGTDEWIDGWNRCRAYCIAKIRETLGE